MYTCIQHPHQRGKINLFSFEKGRDTRRGLDKIILKHSNKIKIYINISISFEITCRIKKYKNKFYTIFVCEKRSNE